MTVLFRKKGVKRMQAIKIMHSQRIRAGALRSATVALLIVLAVALSAQAADSAGKIYSLAGPTVSVSGEGKVTAQPDRAALQLGVQIREDDLARARAEVTQRSNAILAHLASLGIEQRHINATHISAQAEYRWDKQRETQILSGYSVKRSIDLMLMDLSLLPAVIEGSTDAGANQLSPPQLSHSREAELRRDALRLATEDARDNARVIADSLGKIVGQVREINVVSSPRPMPVARDMMMRSSMESAETGAVYSAGDMIFEARLNATFDLADDGKGGV